MPHARIVNDKVIDLIPGDIPEGRFHPDLIAQFVEVGEEVAVGWVRDGEDFAPPPTPEPIPEPEFVAPEKSLTSVEFMDLFTMQEEVGIRTARKDGDMIVESFLDRVLASDTIVLSSPRVVAGLGYLRAQGVLTEERGAQILAGEAPV